MPRLSQTEIRSNAIQFVHAWKDVQTNFPWPTIGVRSPTVREGSSHPTGALTDVRATDTQATAFFGTHSNKAVFLLYNGISKDRSNIGGNVLNGRTLSILDELLPDFKGERIVYGARTRFDVKNLAALEIAFHQFPYDLATKTWF